MADRCRREKVWMLAAQRSFRTRATGIPCEGIPVIAQGTAYERLAAFTARMKVVRARFSCFGVSEMKSARLAMATSLSNM